MLAELYLEGLRLRRAAAERDSHEIGWLIEWKAARSAASRHNPKDHTGWIAAAAIAAGAILIFLLIVKAPVVPAGVIVMRNTPASTQTVALPPGISLTPARD
jgi:hypothetical protein